MPLLYDTDAHCIGMSIDKTKLRMKNYFSNIQKKKLCDELLLPMQVMVQNKNGLKNY